MLLTVLENPEALYAIYGSDVPSFEDVYLQEFTFTNGEDLQLLLIFNTETLPSALPKKWVDKQVNTVQLRLRLLSVVIEQFDFCGSSQLGKLLFEKNGEQINVSYFLNNDLHFKLQAQWIYIESISGFKQVDNNY